MWFKAFVVFFKSVQLSWCFSCFLFICILYIYCAMELALDNPVLVSNCSLDQNIIFIPLVQTVCIFDRCLWIICINYLLIFYDFCLIMENKLNLVVAS